MGWEMSKSNFVACLEHTRPGRQATVGRDRGKNSKVVNMASRQPNRHLVLARGNRGWTQRDLADRVGTTALTIGRWERGETTPSAYFRKRLREIFDLSERELGLLPDEQVKQVAPGPAFIFDPEVPLPLLRMSGLVGRGALLEGLLTRLQTDDLPLFLALQGMPGVGKTALAAFLCHDKSIRRRFEGVLWASLGQQVRSVRRHLARWGSLLRLDIAKWATSNMIVPAIRAAIGQRHMLFVFDDVWSIDDARALLQSGGHNCAYILTTRQLDVASWFHGDVTHVGELGGADGLLLLERLAPHAVRLERAAAGALVGEVGGLPLALSIAGQFLLVQAQSSQQRRLQQAFAQLSDARERLKLVVPQAPLERHSSLGHDVPFSLKNMIHLSERALSEPAKMALRALAVFPPKPATFSDRAAGAVAARPIETLDELVRASLVEAGGQSRLSLHPIIRDYARLVRTRAQKNLAEKRLVAFATRFVEERATNVAVLEQESNMILTAVELANELGDFQSLSYLARVFALFLQHRFPSAFAGNTLENPQQITQELGASEALLRLVLTRGAIETPT